MLTISDLVTPLTSEQVREKTYEVLGVIGVNTTTWKPGAVVRTIIFAESIVIAWLSVLIAGLAQSAFLTFASGSWLTLTAKHVYGVDRELATFASGEVTLVNTGGGIYTLDPGDLTLSNPDTSKTYRNTSLVELAAGATLTIPIVAVEAGSASTAVPGAISVLETPLIGVTCSNALALVGRDAEEDAPLKTRCLEKLGAISPNGPWDSYAYVAKTAMRPDGTLIGVTRTKITTTVYGFVDLYVATATGGVTGDVTLPDTDLGIIFADIQEWSTPLCVTSTVITAVMVPINVTYDLWLYDSISLTDAEIDAAVQAALARHFSTLPIGGNASGEVSHALIERTIASVFPGDTFDVVSVPAANIPAALADVPVVGIVTPTIYRLPRPLGS